MVFLQDVLVLKVCQMMPCDSAELNANYSKTQFMVEVLCHLVRV